ncbi:hypothetical protein BT96DRAFT_301422 [Gymnopus androsaceus JB14]|uniref:Uncharacterized protein n=1 Tax=Gymnopus androsaceus JB14 TaxID=1447944 RepID=A0A6A4H0X6_9AGAR|nr:hypothetical protein BT96DRAFT_301422 [Gymnopus androsaceus JB14]
MDTDIHEDLRDTRLKSLLFLKLHEPFFERGDFPSVVQNGSQSEMLQNPWVNGTNAAPFNQEFYLILNVAVGVTNGDGQGDKPWIDAFNTAMRDFTNAQSTWSATWTEDDYEWEMVVADHRR